MGSILSYGTVCFLFGHGFLCRDFIDQCEIWQEVSPIFQRDLLKFWGQYPRDSEIVAFFSFWGIVWRDMLDLSSELFSLILLCCKPRVQQVISTHLNVVNNNHR